MVIDNGEHLASEDGVTGRERIFAYESSFDTWDTECREGAGTAAEIDSAVNDLARHGIQMTRLALMRTVANSAFKGHNYHDENCAADLAAYVTRREGG